MWRARGARATAIFKQGARVTWQFQKEAAHVGNEIGNWGHVRRGSSYDSSARLLRRSCFDCGLEAAAKLIPGHVVPPWFCLKGRVVADGLKTESSLLGAGSRQWLGDIIPLGRKTSGACLAKGRRS